MYPLQCHQFAMKAMTNVPPPTPPLGFKIVFDPFDYLLKKVLGKPLLSDYIIKCDLYEESKIWKRLFEERGLNTLYYFTKLKRKTNKGSRIERVTDCGTWKCQRDFPIYSLRNNETKHIGSRRNYSFLRKKELKESDPKEKGTSWLMHEYRLDCCFLGKKANNNMDDYVICRINRRTKKEEAEVTTHHETLPMASFSDDIESVWEIGNTGNMNKVELPDVVWKASRNLVSTEVMNAKAGSMSYIDWDSNLCMSLEDLEDHQPVNFTSINAPLLISDHQEEAERLQAMHQHQQLIQYNRREDPTVNGRETRYTTTKRPKLDTRPSGFATGVRKL